MPANAAQIEIGDLRTRIRDENLSPGTRIRYCIELWQKYPSLKNKVRHVRPVVHFIFQRTDEATDPTLRSRCRALLERMEQYDPHAAPESPIEETTPAAAEQETRFADSYQEYCHAIDERLIPMHMRSSNYWLPSFDYSYPQQDAARMIPVYARLAVLFAEAGLAGETIEDYRKLEDILVERRLQHFAPPNQHDVRVPIRFGQGLVWDSYGACPAGFLALSKDLQFLSIAWEVKFTWKSEFTPRQPFSGVKP